MTASSDIIPSISLRYPMSAYPTGWYSLCYGDDLAKDEIKNVNVMGQQLIAVRDQNGKAQVYDAYCPHLGAHLGHGGVIENGHIRCPFHSWEFSTNDGSCQSIPYANRVPAKAELTQYPCDEVNGHILAYFDINGEQPQWHVEPVPEVNDPDWIDCASFEWIVSTRVQEVNENLFDTAHIKFLHGGSDIPTISSTDRKPGTIAYEMRSESGENDIDVKLWAMGFAALRYQLEIPLVEVDSLTPLDEERVLMRTKLFMKDHGDRATNEAIADEVTRIFGEQVDADINIFKHKKHRADPVLCDGDGPISLFRQWAKQFY